MRIVADFHIHSPYSRAVSKEMTLENLDLWAGKKGITVMGTGDFTHPAWIREIKEKLAPAEQGLFVLKNRESCASANATRFVLTVEISSIYSKNSRTRRVHNLIFVPTVEAAEKINAQLNLRGNIKSDGRPILGLDCVELANIVFNVAPDAVIVPAHAWTPWFSIFGSMSGFDSIEECFEKFAPQIFAIETGLSSDPAMNWRCAFLDNIALISNSDSHSLQRISREANVFETELSYDAIIAALKSRDPTKFLKTLEFFPEEGKYHYDGHRLCNFSSAPEETKRLNGICPKCGKKVTVGVLYRVEALSSRPAGEKPAGAIPYQNMVPLDEIIAESFGVGTASKRVKDEYHSLVGHIGTELAVLYDAPRDALERATVAEVAEGIMRVREGRVEIEPGYDGEYGKIRIFREDEQKIPTRQTSLFG